jgi:uncharacterized protein with LGFP repeats
MLKRFIVAGSAVGLGVAGVVAYQLTGGDAPGTPVTHPDPGRVTALPLRDLPGAKPGSTLVGMPAGPTEPFSLLGVTWDKPGTALDGAVRIRTRSTATGAWSPWRRVDEHEEDAPDGREATGSRVRAGTTALWVGPSNGVEVRVAGHGRALPHGLRVELVDPGTGRRVPGPRAVGRGGREIVPAAAAEPIDPSAGPSAGATAPDPAETATPTPTPADSATAAGTASASPGPGTASASPGTDQSTPVAPAAPAARASTAPRPAIVARAQWDADESLVKEPPTIDTSVKAVFVHHTDTGNGYTCAQSASVVHSIFLYHVQSEGWDDIGYNFLVDKCGTIFEGRGGGVDRPVHGAHTYGFNTDSAGVAVLGTYTLATQTPAGVAPTQAALNAVAEIASWKLGLYGEDPTGKVTLTSLAPTGTGKYPYGQKVSFNTVSGHRDAFATACPGQQLYDKLPAIRTTAKMWTTPATTSTLTLTGLTGATKVGTTYYTKGTVTPHWSPAAVSAYEVRVDGTVVARPAPTATSATLTVPAGAHTLQVHATNIDGTTADSPAYHVIADTVRPVFTHPAALGLRRSTVYNSSIPVILSWKATDDRLLRSLKATRPAAKTFSTTTTAWSAWAKRGTSQLWSLTAADAAGNATASAVTRTSALVAETSATRTRTWKTTYNKSYLGGRGLYSATKGASASWTFTGRSVGLITKRAANLGALYVYIDGHKVATVDTRSSTTAYRKLLWAKNWSTSARHTIKIVVAHTSGRPTVAIDGIAYLR